MIRVDLFVEVLILIQAYTVRFWTSTNRYNSLSFVLKFRIQLATIRNYSLHFDKVRKLSQIFVMGSSSIAWYANYKHIHNNLHWDSIYIYNNFWDQSEHIAYCEGQYGVCKLQIVCQVKCHLYNLFRLCAGNHT